ncbi:TetR/AcrR family transcriptional regulator [Dietzia sp. CH92]|uniref:TetR/AcrR family transcriptional regulator n=1 Tax=Dietzia sp. CH92 TaxID=3051823 RepID=UPI0028D30A76|nr:TetR/AcrR family transcriptional regulator [Dietzia sp. CH92]
MVRSAGGPKSDEARRLIAEAACDLVADAGMDHLSMRRVASRLGVTTGYITHYYSGKNDLLEAALLTALAELAPPGGGWSTNLEEWTEAAVSILPNTGGSPRFWRVLTVFQAASLSSAPLSEVLNNYARSTLDNLSAHLADHFARTSDVEPTQEELDGLARALFAFTAGLGTTTVTTPGVLSADQVRALVRSGVEGLIAEFLRRRAGA